MQAFYKGKFHAWVCKKFELGINKTTTGFMISTCRVDCGGEGSYNCITPNMIFTDENLIYINRTGEEKVIGSCQGNEVKFRNRGTGDWWNEWPLGDMEWTLKHKENKATFHFRLYNSKGSGDYIEVLPTDLPVF